MAVAIAAPIVIANRSLGSWTIFSSHQTNVLRPRTYPRVIADRGQDRSTLVVSQLPVEASGAQEAEMLARVAGAD
jgi:hypothetical protein